MRALVDIYRQFHETARLPCSLARRASAPLLINPSADWVKADFKLLVVGQETHGWEYVNEEEGSLTTVRNFQEFSGNNMGVESMLRAYSAFLHESEYWKRNSAFWRAFRICGSAVKAKQSAILWTNIFKIDIEGSVVRHCSRAERELILTAQGDLLKQEINFLSPDIVLFFSGPTYDPALEFAFPDITFHAFAPTIATRELAYIRSAELSPVCLRSFHPSYLQRSRRWSTVKTMTEWLQEQRA